MEYLGMTGCRMASWGETPDISLRQPTAVTSVRAKCLNKIVTEKYFQELTQVIQNLNLGKRPDLIRNIDETNVPLTHKPSKMLAKKGERNIPARVGNCRENVSVLACINSAGQEVPPMAIVRGKTEKVLQAYNTAEGVLGCKYTYKERAWMEDALGELWFRDHFLKSCGPDRPQLILLDSHSSHETLWLLEAAQAKDIQFRYFLLILSFKWKCDITSSLKYIMAA